MIDSFIADLETFKEYPGVTNPYTNPMLRQNLTLYLSQMQKNNPSSLLIGEAPGYQGCRLTGIPFTSEYILENGLSSLAMFGSSVGYAISSTTPHKEPTATMIWNTIANFSLPIPLMWNAFPFHPYLIGKVNSNRRPSKQELVIGQVYLQKLLTLFNIQKIIAVGNSAEVSLQLMGITYEKVRHPSNGGKADFVSGIKSYLI